MQAGGSGEPGTQTGQVIRWVKELTLGRSSQHLEQASRVYSSGRNGCLRAWGAAAAILGGGPGSF